MPKKKNHNRDRVCEFCRTKTEHIDYKYVGLLNSFLDITGKIKPRRKTGVCMHHQHLLSIAIKRARVIALLPIQRKIQSRVNKEIQNKK